jgi:hypothetical protein
MTNCGHCGANLTPADLSQPACRHCGTVLAHYARAAERAAEKVAVVNALLGDANRNGIPDVFEGAAHLGAAPAALSRGDGQPVVIVHSSVVIGGPMGHGGHPGQPPPFAPPPYYQPLAPPSGSGQSAPKFLIPLVLVGLIVLFAGVGVCAFFLVF